MRSRGRWWPTARASWRPTRRPGRSRSGLAALGIESTPGQPARLSARCSSRTPGVGAVHQRRHPAGRDDPSDERERTSRWSTCLQRQGIIPGIKVDEGAKPLAGSPRELITEGLDGLREPPGGVPRAGRALRQVARGDHHRRRPARRDMCIDANAHALARYAALCQEQGLVPIVEPEVLMDGPHTIERCEEVTGARPARGVRRALRSAGGARRDAAEAEHGGRGQEHATQQPSVEEVAAATLRTLRRHVPPAVPGVVFLSGGQDHLQATEHLDAINQLAGPAPWKLSFSYGRALQDEAMEAWQRQERKPGRRAARLSPPRPVRQRRGPGPIRRRRWRAKRLRSDRGGTVAHAVTTRESGSTRAKSSALSAKGHRTGNGNGRAAGHKEQTRHGPLSARELEADARLLAGLQLPLGRDDLPEGQPAAAASR